jgi:hypothetical protein
MACLAATWSVTRLCFGTFKTLYELALEPLGYARNRLCCRPDYVLFNAWYPSGALQKRIRDYGWYYVCPLKKNRRFNNQAVRTYPRHPIGQRPAG